MVCELSLTCIETKIPYGACLFFGRVFVRLQVRRVYVHGRVFGEEILFESKTRLEICLV